MARGDPAEPPLSPRPIVLWGSQGHRFGSHTRESERVPQRFSFGYSHRGEVGKSGVRSATQDGEYVGGCLIRWENGIDHLLDAAVLDDQGETT